MDQLPATWTALCVLGFVLGARHGFDADHLATIDVLTRYNARTNPALARFCGALFSLAHGLERVRRRCCTAISGSRRKSR